MSVIALIVAAFITTTISPAADTQKTISESNASKAFVNKLDPVYMIDIDKYPKFSTEMVLKNGKRLRFASVKAMMNYYFHPEKYLGFGAHSKADVKKMYVKDYLTGEKIDAKDAWYVFGSHIIGPHGDDLIPLSNEISAKLFTKKYGGSRIMRIERFTFGLIHYLDM